MIWQSFVVICDVVLLGMSFFTKKYTVLYLVSVLVDSWALYVIIMVYMLLKQTTSTPEELRREYPDAPCNCF